MDKVALAVGCLGFLDDRLPRSTRSLHIASTGVPLECRFGIDRTLHQLKAPHLDK